MNMIHKMGKKSSGMIANWAKLMLLCLMLPCLGVYAEPYSGTIHWEYSGPWRCEESNLKTVSTATGFKQTCEAKITGYSGSATDITIPKKITMSQTVTDNGDVVVHWEYEATVTSIGDDAFYDRRGLTSVTIPNSVTSIGSSAFYGCSGLTSVTIPNSVTSIGNYAFSGCSGLTSVSIPDSITIIPDYAFRNCSGLTSVTIPDSVTSLGREAFSGCSSLTSISIPESVTYFGASCFEGCPVYTLPLYRMVLGVGGSPGGGSSGGGSAEPVDPRYALAASPADRAIASVTVDRDCAIDSFVLKDGKVYDCVVRVVNTSASEVHLTLPAGYVYETFKGAKPLTIPANSRNILTITRTTGDTFLVSREELQTVQ